MEQCVHMNIQVICQLRTLGLKPSRKWKSQDSVALSQQTEASSVMYVTLKNVFCVLQLYYEKNAKILFFFMNNMSKGNIKMENFSLHSPGN